MNTRSIRVDLVTDADVFEREFRTASKTLLKFDGDVAKTAQAQVAAGTKQRRELEQLVSEYKRVAKESKRGSVEQVEASRLAADAQRKLATQYEHAAGKTRLFHRDTDGLTRGLGGAGRGAAAASLHFHGLGRAASFASAQFLGAAGLVEVFRRSIGAASDLHEQLNKVDVVFGQSAQSVKAWSKESATAFGESRAEALGMAATFGNMLVPMGFARKDAASMSTEIVKLAGDMASFNNASPEEVLKALQSGLAGQVRPLRQFGVFLSQARIKAEALADGIVTVDRSTRAISEAQTGYVIAQSKANEAIAKYGPKSREAVAANLALEKSADRVNKAVAGHAPELTAAQKAMATYQIILKDTKDAQGDFSRTSGGLANQQRILKAQLANLEEEIGTALMPTVLKYTKGLTKWLEKAEKSGEIHRDVEKAVKLLTAAIDAGEDVVKVATKLFNGLSDAVGGDKHAIELLAGAFIALKAAVVASNIVESIAIGRIAAMGAAAATAEGEVVALRTSLLGLSTLGPIAIPIAIAVAYTYAVGGDGRNYNQDATNSVSGGQAYNAKNGKVWVQIPGRGGYYIDAPTGGPPNSAAAEAAAKAAHGKARGAAAAGGHTGGVMWSGDHSGLDQGFKSKLEKCVAAAGGTSINVTSGRRSAEHNSAVGGASQSNHLTGHAADGTCDINGHSYPLGQAPINYSAFGLRAGASFDWNGAPDIYHVDDGRNVGGVSSTPSPTSTSLTGGQSTPTSGKHPSSSSKSVSGSKLLSTSTRLAIDKAASTKSTNDDLAAWKRARTELEALQKTASKSQQVPIADELARVNKQIKALEKADARKAAAAAAAKWRGIMRENAAAMKAEAKQYRDHLAQLEKIAKTAHERAKEQWEKAAQQALDAFDAATQKGLDKIRKEGGAQTAEETALSDFQRKRHTDQLASQDAANQQSLTEAQSKFSVLTAIGVGGVDADGNTIAQGDIDSAAQAVKDAQDTINQAALDAQEEALQTAADNSRANADQRAQDLEDAYSKQRDIEKQNLQDFLDYEEQQFESGKGDWKSFMEELQGLAASGGWDAGTAFWQQWDEARKSSTDATDADDAVKKAKRQGAGAPPKLPGNVRHLGIPQMAAGGIVTRPTLAIIGEAGPEAIIPLSGHRVGAGVGGTTPPVLSLQVISDRDLAARLAPYIDDTGSALVRLKVTT